MIDMTWDMQWFTAKKEALVTGFARYELHSTRADVSVLATPSVGFTLHEVFRRPGHIYSKPAGTEPNDIDFQPTDTE